MAPTIAAPGSRFCAFAHRAPRRVPRTLLAPAQRRLLMWEAGLNAPACSVAQNISRTRLCPPDPSGTLVSHIDLIHDRPFFWHLAGGLQAGVQGASEARRYSGIDRGASRGRAKKRQWGLQRMPKAVGRCVSRQCMTPARWLRRSSPVLPRWCEADVAMLMVLRCGGTGKEKSGWSGPFFASPRSCYPRLSAALP